MTQQSSPPKTVSTVVTFLEMKGRPRKLSTQFPLDNVRIAREEKPSIAYYRYLYDVVGRDYFWVNRKWWSDEKLARTIHDDAVEIHVLHAGSEIAGFAELDFRMSPDTEITFFGLMPNFVGHGLSRPFLEGILQRSWQRSTKRVHLQTCTCDHPAALPLYQKMGFNVYGRTTETLTPFDG